MRSIYRDAKHWVIHLALCTDPEKNSCFLFLFLMFFFLPNQLDEIDQVIFFFFMRHLVRALFTFLLTVFRGFVDCISRFYLKFSKKIIFFPSVNTDEPNFVTSLVFVGATETVVIETTFWLPSQNSKYSQWYSELRKPIKTRKNYCQLIWQILMVIITGSQFSFSLCLLLAEFTCFTSMINVALNDVSLCFVLR